MATSTLKNSKTDHDGQAFNLILNKLTAGELMAITRALKYYDSAVGNDVLGYILNAIQGLGNTELSKTIGDSLIQLGKEIQEQKTELDRVMADADRAVTEANKLLSKI